MIKEVFVLMVMLQNACGGGVSFGEFDDKAACKRAGKGLDTLNDNYSVVHGWLCTPKGTAPDRDVGS